METRCQNCVGYFKHSKRLGMMWVCVRLHQVKLNYISFSNEWEMATGYVYFISFRFRIFFFFVFSFSFLHALQCFAIYFNRFNETVFFFFIYFLVVFSPRYIYILVRLNGYGNEREARDHSTDCDKEESCRLLHSVLYWISVASSSLGYGGNVHSIKC